MQKRVFDSRGVKSKITVAGVEQRLKKAICGEKQIRCEEFLLRTREAVVKKFSGGE